MIDIFSGDPKLVMTLDGSKLVFKGGQPMMDQGLENLALISLFTGKGWVGNAFISDPDKKIGSDFEIAANRPVTLKSLNDIALAGEKALDNPAFGKLMVDVTNPNSYRVDATITIESPGKDINTLILTKNGQNWINQNVNPAYRRI